MYVFVPWLHARTSYIFAIHPTDLSFFNTLHITENEEPVPLFKLEPPPPLKIIGRQSVAERHLTLVGSPSTGAIQITFLRINRLRRGGPAVAGRPRSKRHPPYRLRCRPGEQLHLLRRLRLSRSLRQQHRHLHRPFSIRQRLRVNEANRNSCPVLHCDKQLAKRLRLSSPSPVPRTQKNHYQI